MSSGNVRNVEKVAEMLIEYLRKMDKVVLAFSGGVDSSLLAYMLRLTGVDFKAVMVVTEFISGRRVAEAVKTSRELGFGLLILRRRATEEMLRNDGMRCYYCKRMIFSEIRNLYPLHTIFDGTNASDLKRRRPGLRALREFNILSPFAELGVDKETVRELAKHFNLDFYDRPSDSCLATRIFGKITKEKLEFVDVAERVAEKVILRSLRSSGQNSQPIPRLRVRVRASKRLGKPDNYFEIFLWDSY